MHFIWDDDDDETKCKTQHKTTGCSRLPQPVLHTLLIRAHSISGLLLEKLIRPINRFHLFGPVRFQIWVKRIALLL